MIDLVVPHGNEEGFVQMAERLGYDGLVFLVNDPKKIRDEQQTLARLRQKTALSLSTGVLLQGAGKRHRDAAVTIIRAPDNPRAMIEQRATDFLLDIEMLERKDRMHHRASGMNHVIAKLASERGVGICFAFSTLLSADLLSLPVLLGRMKLNIRLAAKYRIKVLIGSFASSPFDMRNPRDIMAFFSLQGMQTHMLNQAFSL